MSSFKKWLIINEIFNFKGNVNNHINNSGFFEAMFSANNILYTFRASRRKESNTWLVSFFDHLDGDDKFNKQNNNKSALKVFSGVFKSLEMLMDKHPEIDTIIFDAAYKELKDLYIVMDKVIKKKFPDWKLKKTGKQFTYNKG